MKIQNEAVLDRFRGPGICLWCRKPVTRREPDHVFTRGAGQLDISINIAGLCAPFVGGACHAKRHGGSLPLRAKDGQDGLLERVAAREMVLAEDIVTVVHLFRRLPKDAPEATIDREIGQLGESAADLARRVYEREIKPVLILRHITKKRKRAKPRPVKWPIEVVPCLFCPRVVRSRTRVITWLGAVHVGCWKRLTYTERRERLQQVADAKVKAYDV